MARGPYHPVNPESQRIRQEALLQLRRARLLVPPALLEHVRQIIAAQAEKSKPAPVQDNISTAGKVPVDHKKNMTTILKFLELKSGDKALHSRVRSLLSEGLN